MIYRVRHLTEYVYSEAVTTSHHELHLLARAAPGQTIYAERLEVTPEPAVRRDRTDWFGNRCTHLAIHERHTRLAVTSLLTLEVKAPPPATSDDERPWESARDWARAAESPDARAAIDFVLPSPRIAVVPGALELATPSFAAGRPLFDAVRDLTRRIHEEFSYDTAATDVSTSVEEVLNKGRGVCQDFAHVQIACLRALGIPARYVSGYLVTTRAEGAQRLVGADASHAWVSVRMPGGRWVDFDPTNDVVPSDRHLTIAYGRDFGDVTPMRGVLLGGGRHQLRVGVDVTPTGT
jgi:transglutaminase-like putative cysteine protease